MSGMLSLRQASITSTPVVPYSASTTSARQRWKAVTYAAVVSFTVPLRAIRLRILYATRVGRESTGSSPMLGGQLFTRIVFVGNLSICPRMKVSDTVGRYVVTTQTTVSVWFRTYLSERLFMKLLGSPNRVAR